MPLFRVRVFSVKRFIALSLKEVGWFSRHREGFFSRCRPIASSLFIESARPRFRELADPRYRVFARQRQNEKTISGKRERASLTRSREFAVERQRALTNALESET
jgi:hypothetical protein